MDMTTKKGTKTVRPDADADADVMTVIRNHVRADRKGVISGHHHESYERFMTRDVPAIVNKETFPIRFRKQSKSVDADGAEVSHAVAIDVYVGGEDGSGVRVRPPGYFPNQARLTSATYALDLVSDVRVVTTVTTRERGKTHQTSSDKVYKDMAFGRLPVMVGSRWCATSGAKRADLEAAGEDPDDVGGYFVADGGMDKVVVAQLEGAVNVMSVSIPDSGDAGHAGHDDMTKRKVLVGRTQCVSADELDRAWLGINVYRTPRDGEVYLTVESPVLRDGEHALWDVFCAMGVTSDRAIVELVCGGDEGMADLLFGSAMRRTTWDVVEAQDEIIRGKEFQEDLKKEWLLLLLAQQRVPGVTRSEAEALRLKAAGLADMVRQLLRALAGAPTAAADRDDAGVLRVKTTGRIFRDVFRSVVYQWANEVRSAITRVHDFMTTKTSALLLDLVNETNVRSVMNVRYISEQFELVMKGLQDDKDKIQLGVVQDLSRGTSLLSTLSHLRRVNNPIDHTTSNVTVRDLDSKTFGRIDPVETPDGASIGLLHNLSICARVTPGFPATDLVPVLDGMSAAMFTWLSDAKHRASEDTSNVYVNGAWWGVSEAPLDLARELRTLRRDGDPRVPWSTSVSVRYDLGGDVYLATDAGRLTRPLLLTGMPAINTPASTIDDLVAAGAAEYVDVAEEQNVSVQPFGLSPSGPRDDDPPTHAEIHPAATLGVVSACIPMINHCQGPRALLAAGQIKQAIGTYAPNQYDRFDTVAYRLMFPQTPLVRTSLEAPLFGDDSCRYGTNVTVAVMTSTGHHIEDGIILNRGSLDRGCFAALAYKTVRASELNERGRTIRIAPSIPESVAREADRSMIDPETGVIRVGSVVDHPRSGAARPVALVQMEQLARTDGNANADAWVRSDASMLSSKSKCGRVDRTHSRVHPDKNVRAFRVRLSQVRDVVLGDKFASCSGQKGTVCRIVDEEEMPYSSPGGVRPDLIFNPHAFPKRMTPNYQLAQLLGFLAVQRREASTTDPFAPVDIDAVMAELEAAGLEDRGLETFVDGRTGAPMSVRVFSGPMFYARLKHQVKDKVHARAPRGAPVDRVTRQPIEGRAREGGLRMGQMETNVIASHGVAGMLSGQMDERSDGTEFRVCGECSCYVGPRASSCPVHVDAPVERVRHPYAFKVMAQELSGLGVGVDMFPDMFPDMSPPVDDDDDDAHVAHVAPPERVSDVDDSAVVSGGGDDNAFDSAGLFPVEDRVFTFAG